MKKIQAGVHRSTAFAYIHQPTPPAPPPIDFPRFTEEAFKTQFPSYLNFLLQFCPEVPEEAAVRLQFAAIGIGPGLPFDFEKLTDVQKASWPLP